jgi:hypothetical protein
MSPRMPASPVDPPYVGENAPWSHPTAWWRRNLVGVGTVGFLALAVGAAWGSWEVTDHGSCGARVICVINNNAGVAALYGLLLAVIGVAVTLLIRAVDEDSEAQRYLRVRRQATYEAWHNLQHHARSWQRYGHLINRGDILLDRATELASDPLAKRLAASEAEQIDHMRRNLQVLARLPWNDASEASRDHVRWFIEQALRFVVLVARDDKVARGMITQFHPRAEDDRAAVMTPLCDLAAALAVKEHAWTVQFHFDSSWQGTRSDPVQVVCWDVEAGQDAPKSVHVLGASLSGLRDPP